MVDNLLFTYLKNNPVFAKMEPHVFQTIENYFTFRQLNVDDVLFYEGEHGDSVAFVLVGKLAIFRTKPDGAVIQIGHVHAGGCIGEISLIDTLANSATVKAVEVSAAVSLNRKNFEKILQEYPRIGIELLYGISTILSLKLRRASEKLSHTVN